MFVGEKLTDIRLLHGYSRNDLAKMLDVSEQSVWQYENNYNGPKLEVMIRLKSIFNVKTKYFYNDTVYKTQFDPSFVAYRSKTINSIIKTKYEAVHLEFIEGLLNIFEDEIEYPQNKLLTIREYAIHYLNQNNGLIEKKEMIQHVAQYAREKLELEFDNQRLMFLLEKNGAFIFEKSLGDNIDAYSTWSKQDRPIIMLGTFKKSGVRRNFDLAHELGHLLLHYKMDLSDLTKSEYKTIEAEAHDFSSYFLMPQGEFIEDLKQIKRVSNPKSYIELKEKWSVSIVAMAYYARKLDYMTYEQYRYFYASLNRLGYDKVEPLDDTIKIIRPGKVKSSIQFLFEDKILTLQELMNLTNYNEVLIANILGVEESFINDYLEKEPPSFNISYINQKRKIH